MNKAEQTIQTALTGVREELAKHQNGSGSVSNPEQLKRFEMQLAGMLEDLHQGSFNAERAGLGYAVADSWPLGHELTNRICAAAQVYERTAKRGSA